MAHGQPITNTSNPVWVQRVQLLEISAPVMKVKIATKTIIGVYHLAKRSTNLSARDFFSSLKL